MTTGENIKRIRIKRNMTQKELGEKLGGISQQQIGQWETGKVNPKIETIQKIAHALNVDWNIFITENYIEKREKEIMDTLEQTVTMTVYENGIANSVAWYTKIFNFKRKLILKK